MRPSLLEAPASIFMVFFVQAFLFICLFLALIFDVTELTLFSLIILMIGLVAYFWHRASLNRVTCEVTMNRKRLFPGERLKIGIRAINAKLIPILFKVDLFIPRAVAGSEEGQWFSEEQGLLWFQQRVFLKEFTPNRRGVFNLGPPSIRGGDLFGFFFRHQVMPDDFEIIVYPRIAGIRSLTLPKKEFFGIPGAKSPVEDPVYVFGTRDYQPGRPARRIHWKASARHNRLQEKLCEPAEQEKVLLILDVDGFKAEGAVEEFEKCIEVIAALVLQMDRRSIAVGFATNGKIFGNKSRIIPISRNSFQMAAILETLARVTTDNTGLVGDIIAKGFRIPWGVSSLYFAWKRSKQTRVANTFMKQRNTPIQFILGRKTPEIETTDVMHAQNIVYLEDILVRKNRKQ
jgi:uncharacterized protein (DUF58 family)